MIEERRLDMFFRRCRSYLCGQCDFYESRYRIHYRFENIPLSNVDVMR